MRARIRGVVRSAKRHKAPPGAIPSTPAPGEAWEGALAHVAAEAEETVSRGLQPGADLKALAALVQRVHGRFDDLEAALALDPPVACRRGCIHCCCNPVSLSQPEALRLGLFLEHRFTPAQRDVAAARAREITARMRGLDVAGLGAIRHELPCPILLEGTCGVHPVRPLVCRGWNSIDADHCRLSNELADPQHPIESHAAPRQLAEALQLGMLRGVRRAGLEAGYLALPRAVVLLAEFGAEHLGRIWLAGGPMFAGRVW